MRKGVIFPEPTFAFDWLSSRQVMILERSRQSWKTIH